MRWKAVELWAEGRGWWKQVLRLRSSESTVRWGRGGRVRQVPSVPRTLYSCHRDMGVLV